MAGPRVTPGDIERILREQAAAHPDGPPPPSVVLLAELPGHADGFIGCIEVTTTDAAAAVAAPGQPALDGYLGARACVAFFCACSQRLLQRAGMLAVEPRFGSRGVGRALVAAGEALSRDVYGCAAVVLFVLSVRDDILAWYTRRGYERTGLRVEARELIASIQQDARLLVEADFVVLRRVL